MKTIAYPEHGTPHGRWQASASRDLACLYPRQSTDASRVSLSIFFLR
jgi:hypothetical protein